MKVTNRPDIDIVLVTYNSSKWVQSNFQSILSSDYDLKKVHLYYYDNASSDSTVSDLIQLQAKHSHQFGSFEVFQGNKNRGFGHGNNRAVRHGHSPYLFFLNIDTELAPDTLSKVARAVASAPATVATWELRQTPYEHPKYYDPVTGFTPWSSAACLVVRRDVFERIHGFDQHLFMYCEDVDLSWACRGGGAQP